MLGCAGFAALVGGYVKYRLDCGWNIGDGVYGGSDCEGIEDGEEEDQVSGGNSDTARWLSWRCCDLDDDDSCDERARDDYGCLTDKRINFEDAIAMQGNWPPS